MDLEKILKAMSLVDELVKKLNYLDDETLELSVKGTSK